jgi:hypothetical protein
MSAAVALLVWASRPRWHTSISRIIPEFGVALSIQYPDGWEKVNMPGPGEEFVRQPPHGLNRWLREHLFKQDFSFSNRDSFIVDASRDDTSIDGILKQVEAEGRNYILTVRRFPHVLGPALAVTARPTPLSLSPESIRVVIN